MRITRLIVAAMLLALSAGCAMRVPLDRLRYVGVWEGETASLLITEEGYVRYQQFKVDHYGPLESVMETGVDGPLQGFDGDNFTIGVGPVRSHFVVDKPPYQDGDQWKMVVRKRELVRIDP